MKKTNKKYWAVVITNVVTKEQVKTVFTYAYYKIDALSNARYRAKKCDNDCYKFEAYEIVSI